ncbi:hypothetical protein FDW83_12205 [Pseudarthrobacter sp. NamE2]|uniref:hypothetical protein n=1 Tax=Pseudarthrobacter sp. NamE2 TaxID=2576838 RepID=UPI0010FDB1C7|nr:hypothetical protein [Pseudarthrobacter sp. NamE2]TLM82707.1 hypothetical protein FDW83_12205 [Pseudarthrobacter sp. NamE2]
MATAGAWERLSVLSAWRETRYFDEQEQAALALAEYVTGISDSHANTGLYESAAEGLTPGQMSAVSWMAMSINTSNRVAIGSSYKVAPPGTARNRATKTRAAVRHIFVS